MRGDLGQKISWNKRELLVKELEKMVRLQLYGSPTFDKETYQEEVASAFRSVFPFDEHWLVFVSLVLHSFWFGILISNKLIFNAFPLD